ncbi:dicarboxylate/amino acid:cation symporter [Mucilaginibacter sp. McL0603]|uniref:dicarboxylate/amino acid:cation symporter n=1 Tax=Mucilaginibacter sp. McL0603 TaxID=3415670 RepID=UPI003CE9CBF3
MIWLLTGIIAGSIAGIVFGKQAEIVKPVGDIFLNLLFVAVIPLVFFGISSAIANIQGSQKLGRIMGVMAATFLVTVLIAALVTIAAVWLFPIHQNLALSSDLAAQSTNKSISGDQLTQLFTTGEFFQLLSRRNMLAMIIFAILVGFGTLKTGEKGHAFKQFLNAGNEVFKNVFILIMKPAPIGLGAYFAYQVALFGPSLFGTYAHTMGIGYGVSIFYYAVFFSLYAFIAGGLKGIKAYWKNNIIPSATAIGTCSSIATIPANLEAAKKMGVSDVITGITIPLGGTLHKEGSSISSILKMAVVFAMFGRSFNGPEVILLALGMTVLVSIVEGGIPNGGYVGEILFISAYGLPPEALPPAIIIGTLIDPIATLLNATGDTVAAMMINRFVQEKNKTVFNTE